MTVLEFILKMTKPYRLWLYGMALAICFVALDRNIKPYLIKIIIDNVSQNNYTDFGLILGIYALVQFGLVAAWSCSGWCQNKFYPQLTAHITKSLMTQVSAYPYRFFQEQLSGSITAKITDAAHRTPRILNIIIVEYFHLIVVIGVSVVLLATVHYAFALSILVWIASFVLVSYYRLKKAEILSNLEAEVDAKVRGRLVDYFANIFTIKIFTSQNFEKNRLGIELDDYVNKSRTRGLYLRSYFTLQGIIFSVYFLLCIVGMLYLSKNSIISAGDFALVFMLNFEIVSWLFQMAGSLNNFVSDWGTVGQALTIIQDIPEVQDKPAAKDLKITQAKITFDKVHFSYKDSEKLFDNKCVTIEPGTKVGLVGYSGGGKTTFANLILRLYDVNSGSVLIDDQDVCNVTQESLRSVIGMIPQDPTLFHRSLLENIRYGRLDATDAEVITAAKLAHADEFINRLPNRYDSLVGERGVKLSGGQRQRVAIARALLKNAPILIMDEATSQLDSITETVIQKSLWDLMQNKTTIVIAHRLATLLHMDRILVFKQGKIVEDGTHKELIAENGVYKDLWDTQVGGFIVDPN